ncbi:hypothetical protein ACTXT7_008179, partial [Hymenolepis weldensis]
MDPMMDLIILHLQRGRNPPRIGTLAVGVIFLLIFSNLDKNTGLYISVAVFTSLGFFLIFLSILGIVGVSRKNRPVLICFASFLILLLVIRTVMGIVLIAKPDVAMPLVKEACLHFINVINDHSEEPEIVQLASDVGNWYQESKCCGYDGPEDLKNPNETCCISTFNCELTNYSGCKDIIQRAVENLSTTFGGIELGFLPLPIIFVTCSFRQYEINILPSYKMTLILLLMLPRLNP